MTLNSEEAERFLPSRRSIRTFHDRPVEREKLEKLVDMACYAPSAKNIQTWHWVVVENGQEVKRLARMVIEWMRGILSKNRELDQNLGFVRVVEARAIRSPYSSMASPGNPPRVTWKQGLRRSLHNAPAGHYHTCLGYSPGWRRPSSFGASRRLDRSPDLSGTRSNPGI